MTLQPLGTQILVRFLRPPEADASAIYIPNPDLGPPRAIVVAHGSGRNALGKLIPFDTQVGDTVLVGRQINGSEIKADGEVWGVMDEGSLLGIETIE